MIINPQSGSSGIKLLAHNVVTIPYDGATVEVPVPTSLFVFATRGANLGCVGMRGASVGGSSIRATLSTDGNELSLYCYADGNIEYWAFG